MFTLQIIALLGLCWQPYFYNIIEFYDFLMTNMVIQIQTHWIPDNEMPSNNTDDIWNFMLSYQNKSLEFPYLFHCDNLLNATVANPAGITWGMLGIHPRSACAQSLFKGWDQEYSTEQIALQALHSFGHEIGHQFHLGHDIGQNFMGAQWTYNYSQLQWDIINEVINIYL